ncbi:hypothetical protein FMGBMHLM_0601 [Methylobacterium aerolatum]|nr:hypothetical protein FMGBMHLM_0601 [Methylobacterium aerolatum]
MRPFDGGIARQADRLSQTILATTPVSMFLFNKSAALVLVVSAAVAVAGYALAGRVRPVGPGVPRPLRILALAVPACFAVSALASPDPVRSLDILAGAGIVTAAGLTTVFIRRTDHDVAAGYVALSITVACAALIIVEEWADMPLHRAIGVRSESFVLKRTAVCNTLVLLGLLRFMLGRLRPSLIGLVGLLQLGAITAAHSGAAAFGLLGFGGALLAVRFGGPSLAKAVGAAWIAGCLLVAPFLGTAANQGWEGLLVRTLEAFHLEERIAIWEAFGSLVGRRPVLGYGFGSSQEIVGSKALHGAGDPALDAARNLHPHNAYLQVWVEFGAVGAGLSFALFWWLIAGMDGTDGAFALRFGIVLFCCVLMLLSHSLWQPWWIASVAIAFTWLRLGGGPGARPAPRDGAPRPA